MILSINLKVPLTERECLSLLKALGPDNALAPRGVSIYIECEEGAFVARITCSQEVQVLTCRNTVDDLLEHLSIALSVVRKTDYAFKSSHEA